MAQVLIIGGYGVFGRRAAERLAGRPGLEVIVAGRDGNAAAALAARLAGEGKGEVGHRALDATRLTAKDLAQIGVHIVIHAAGPYQQQDYSVARAAIGAGAHYIDLADARGFVTGIGMLDAEAKAKDVLVVSGASSVPALAAAVIDEIIKWLPRLEHLRYGIVPGNSFDPGVATVASILGGAGRGFTTLDEGAHRLVHGWLPLERVKFPGLGTRWLGHCDVPDLDLFPLRYPTLHTQHFLAGLEVKAFHAAVMAQAWLVWAGLAGKPDRLARPMLWLKRRLGFLGSDRGLMFIEATGRDAEGRPRRHTWRLVASEGHGPTIPATPAVIIACKLASGGIAQRGAMPCLGLFTLDEFSREVADLSIAQDFA